MKEEDFYDSRTGHNLFELGDLVKFVSKDIAIVGWVRVLHYGDEAVYLSNMKSADICFFDDDKGWEIMERTQRHPLEVEYRAKFCDWDSFEILKTMRDEYDKIMQRRRHKF